MHRPGDRSLVPVCGSRRPLDGHNGGCLLATTMTTEDMRQMTQDMASRPTIFSGRDHAAKATVAAEPRESASQLV